MNIEMRNERGALLFCEATMSLSLNFTSQTLCRACGQPRSFAQQVIYPGTAGIARVVS